VQSELARSTGVRGQIVGSVLTQGQTCQVLGWRSVNVKVVLFDRSTAPLGRCASTLTQDDTSHPDRSQSNRWPLGVAESFGCFLLGSRAGQVACYRNRTDAWSAVARWCQERLSSSGFVRRAWGNDRNSRSPTAHAFGCALELRLAVGRTAQSPSGSPPGPAMTESSRRKAVRPKSPVVQSLSVAGCSRLATFLAHDSLERVVEPWMD